MDRESIQRSLVDNEQCFFLHDETPVDGACFYHAVCSLLREKCYESSLKSLE